MQQLCHLYLQLLLEASNAVDCTTDISSTHLWQRFKSSIILCSAPSVSRRLRWKANLLCGAHQRGKQETVVCDSHWVLLHLRSCPSVIMRCCCTLHSCTAAVLCLVQATQQQAMLYAGLLLVRCEAILELIQQGCVTYCASAALV